MVHYCTADLIEEHGVQSELIRWKLSLMLPTTAPLGDRDFRSKWLVQCVNETKGWTNNLTLTIHLKAGGNCNTQSPVVPDPSPGSIPLEASLWVPWLGQQLRRGKGTKPRSWPLQKFTGFQVSVLRNFFLSKTSYEILVFNNYSHSKNVCIFSLH